jgi:hypothetical protein
MKNIYSVEIVFNGHSIRTQVAGYDSEDIVREVLESIEVYVEDDPIPPLESD